MTPSTIQKDTILKMSVSALSQALQKKELSSVECTQIYLEQIRSRENEIHAFITVLEQSALRQAAEIDRRRLLGEPLSALAGVPMALKDNICTQDVRTTCASRMLADFVPPYSAHAAQRLEQEGAILLGKLNMDEFAMGSTTESSYFGPTCNPCGLSRVPGGSSGGSAAAVRAQEAAFTLGSDTGGSIRQPAAFCGVVGVKPTYGRVSRYGLVAFASSLDQIGPITRTVEDAALVLQAIAGHDPRDATSSRHPVDCLPARRGGVKGMRIALPREYFGEGLSPDVERQVRRAAAVFQREGATVDEVSLSSLEHALPAYYVLSSAEASSNLSRFDGVKFGFRAPDCKTAQEVYERSRSEGFGREVKRRILLGSFVLSAGSFDAYYRKAVQARALIAADFQRIFQDYDCILSPVAPTTAYRLGEKTASPLEMYRGDAYTVPVNIAGLPALSLPFGNDADGLPAAIQLIGAPFTEGTLFQAAQALEKEESAL